MAIVIKGTDPSPDNPSYPIRVDSLREVYAYVDAYPHASGPWEVVSETRSNRDGGATLTVELRAPDGDQLVLVFDTAHFGTSGGTQRFGGEPTIALDELLAKVATFAAANPPYHPGSLPRFPVPSLRYPGRIEVPVAILAADDAGRAGLFAPARVVVVSMTDGEPYGIGDFPGFDPDRWPPERLGDWPPPAISSTPRGQLAAMVARFNGVWLRLIDASVLKTTYPQSDFERREAGNLLGQLDVSGMGVVYREMNGPFWAWMETI